MRKTLIMIPAFGCDGGLYTEVAARLSPHMEVLTHIAHEDRYEAMAKALLDVAPAHFAVLGTSMGGRLALEVTLAAPERVEGLVVIGAGAGGVADPSAGLRRSARLRGGEIESVLSEMGDMVAHLPGPRGPSTRQAFIDMGRKMGSEVMARQSDALAHRADQWQSISNIACPVLCLWGSHDQFSPLADGRRLAAGVQRGRFVELPECGHFPTLEYPDALGVALASWLSTEVYAASA